VKLRYRALIYGVALLGAVSAVLLSYLGDRPWLFALAEAGLLALAVYGWRLSRQAFEPLELLSETTRLLAEQEFTTRLSPVGQPEMDQLIQVYNRMSEILRQQRIHNREQKYFLQKMLETTRSGIVVFDFDGRVEHANPAAETFLETSLQAMRGKTLAELDSPLAASLDRLGDDAPQVFPFQGRRRLKCAPAQFVDRGFYKRYIFIDELTAELRQTEKRAYEKLIRVMSHEINNSLGAAHSLLHSCLHYAPQIADEDRDDFRRALEVAIARAEHLKTFLADYAAVVKLPPPKPAPVDPKALLDRVRALMAPELERRRIEWVWDANPLGAVAMDASQMEQVFLNVVKNAMEAVDGDGTLTVRIGLERGRRRIAVEDSGPGVPPEVASQLFTPFYTTKPSGQGIGLTLAAEILNNHGFDFGLESRPDRPTRFVVWL